MDVLRKLKMETKGIHGSVRKYTSEPYIINALEELIRAVEEKQLEEILYLLELVDDWYGKNQSEIQSNSYVSNKQHIDIEQKIKSYIVELKEYKDEVVQVESTQVPVSAKHRLFISHASADKKVCDAFVNLLEELGVPEEEILYSSSSRHGIPGDMDIFEYLKSNISNGITVYYMLSDNYYQSAYCLNEMGAAWVTQNDSSTFILPNFTVGIKGVIDSNRKAYKLSDPVELIQLKNKILKEFGGKISEGKWETVKSEFLEAIKG
ncbi:toll/interleukin-1 receptor domain-containing protein [Bacillus sp. FJAT-51639]|uniref:Toll/interleukin-1 receptor domain-containing protein n=1 Tax=Bacillus bruguierae TaxID=3127667 RepID=A0ABU8FH33_9BACI